MDRITFNPDEMKSNEFYPTMRAEFPGGRKFNWPVAPKENYYAVFRHEMPLWIPVGSDRRMFAPRIDPDNVVRCQVSEARPLQPEEMTGGKDKHGVEWVYVPVAGGSMVKPGKPLLDDANDWERLLRFPDLDSWD